MKDIVKAIEEVYDKGYISEQWFEDRSIPVDVDAQGNQWLLRSEADHLRRSKVLYHPTIIQAHKDKVTMSLNKINDNKISVHSEAKRELELNKQCEQAFLKALDLPSYMVIDGETFHLLTLEHI